MLSQVSVLSQCSVPVLSQVSVLSAVAESNVIAESTFVVQHPKNCSGIVQRPVPGDRSQETGRFKEALPLLPPKHTIFKHQSWHSQAIRLTYYVFSWRRRLWCWKVLDVNVKHTGAPTHYARGVTQEILARAVCMHHTCSSVSMEVFLLNVPNLYAVYSVCMILANFSCL